ncbi:MAG: hypothetical protein MJ206_03715 [Bacilli bacterium]|nr:hypothetical protein [Bacilli bacterium]
MILLLVAIWGLLLGSVSLVSSTVYHSIDHAFTSLNYALPDLWVVTDVEGELEAPLYDTYLVETTSIQHLSHNLKGVIDRYQIGFYYFDAETMEEVEGRYVSGVRLSLRAAVPFTSDYYKAMNYLITETNYAE